MGFWNCMFACFKDLMKILLQKLKRGKWEGILPKKKSYKQVIIHLLASRISYAQTFSKTDKHFFCKDIVLFHEISISKNDSCRAATRTLSQWRHKSKISEKFGGWGRQNMLRPYQNIWDWDWIFGRTVKAFSSLCVCSPWAATMWLSCDEL